MIIRRAAWWICVGLAGTVLGSCGVSDEIAAVCSRASDFESSMVAVDQSI